MVFSMDVCNDIAEVRGVSDAFWLPCLTKEVWVSEGCSQQEFQEPLLPLLEFPFLLERARILSSPLPCPLP